MYYPGDRLALVWERRFVVELTNCPILSDAREAVRICRKSVFGLIITLRYLRTLPDLYEIENHISTNWIM